jgi:predicted P-loop ATPase
MPKIARSAVRYAIISRANEQPYHPILDYLNDLEWDGEARVETWLIDHLGCNGVEKLNYNKLIGKMFFVQAVARIFCPGCQADYMLILEGPQGILKSSACKVLFGNDYFSDNLKLHDINSKDAKLHLRGKWGIEFSEMDGINKIDADKLKAFMTRTHEKYRPPFGEGEVEEPRQNVFIGTCNKDSYLRDETGGRRYWGTACGTINLELLKHDRDQLWAEAVVMFKRGDRYWPTEEDEKKYIEPEQDARYEYDIWHDDVVSHLCALIPNADGRKKTTIPDIARNALRMEIDRADQLTQKRISAILRKLGWTAHRTTLERWWQSPPGWSA